MNRPILFRGKRMDNGEWIIGYYMRYGWTGEIKDRIMTEGASALYAFEVDPSTIGQFTGLTDRNGKKVFEGDIVMTDLMYHHGCVGVIEYMPPESQYSPPSFCMIELRTDYDNGFKYRSAYVILAEDYKNIEVIGNIHDSPELLQCIK